MADQWFYDRRFGPFSAAQLKELAARGRLEPTDMVWKEGMGKGVPAARVRHLFPEIPVEDLRENTSDQATYLPWSSSQEPLENHSSSIPDSGARLAPWLPFNG